MLELFYRASNCALVATYDIVHGRICIIFIVTVGSDAREWRSCVNAGPTLVLISSKWSSFSVLCSMKSVHIFEISKYDLKNVQIPIAMSVTNLLTR